MEFFLGDGGKRGQPAFDEGFREQEILRLVDVEALVSFGQEGEDFFTGDRALFERDPGVGDFEAGILGINHGQGLVGGTMPGWGGMAIVEQRPKSARESAKERMRKINREWKRPG